MTKKQTAGTKRLRQRAEAVLAKKPTRKAATSGPRTSHELDVHRVELELQNEELRTARVALESALERYTEVFDFAPLGYVTLSPEGEIRELNHAAAALLGGERSKLVGRRFKDFVVRTSWKACQQLFESALAEGNPVAAELELGRNDEPFPVRMRAAALRKESRTLLVAFEDISERKARDVELARTERALRDANERKDEFIAMLSHELRNPLTPIMASVEVLRVDSREPAVAAQALEIIERSASHLTRLIDDLLDVTRITRGKIRLQREPVGAVALVRAVLDDYRTTLAARGLHLETRIPDKELWLLGDRDRLSQLVANLLANAEKFTPAGGSVLVTLEMANGKVVLRVTDTGIGIEHDVLDHLLEPFAQAPQALDRTRGGIGLGLALVKGIAELHGGSVKIRSDGIGRGAEVTVTLPLSELRPVPATPPTPRSVPSRRILIVEDKVDVAESLRRVLALKGHVVEAARDGHEALTLARTFRPEVVLCDIGLPDIDGYAVARAFRADRELADVCLVALSGYARPEDITCAQEAGFDHHIAKPPQLDDIDDILVQQRPRSNSLY